jgi:hypothetical protein
MKEVLSLATFAIGVLCFVTFVTTVKPMQSTRYSGEQADGTARRCHD